ncbi:protein of unknown function [Chitinophaga eiseniae]|uniref:DUF4133 domain-containing protein n=1 Tax=Chitinophaga eiseniae TaxID=634771 RepID=A0A1T4MMS3_9BACT|nr:DUF4133 domain-containing protein [Chitinophaga eiseniae]SJZ68253.1 protein of unknown function [Chitinophaga eiseniae]
MANSVYTINKGINVSIEFKGLKAQYIWYLAGGLLGIMILFAILYIMEVNAYVCVAIALGMGTGLVVWVYRLSNTYGEHGLSKKWARRQIPSCIRTRNGRGLFIGNLSGGYGKSAGGNVANYGGRT